MAWLVSILVPFCMPGLMLMCPREPFVQHMSACDAKATMKCLVSCVIGLSTTTGRSDLATIQDRVNAGPWPNDPAQASYSATLQAKFALAQDLVSIAYDAEWTRDGPDTPGELGVCRLDTHHLSTLNVSSFSPTTHLILSTFCRSFTACDLVQCPKSAIIAAAFSAITELEKCSSITKMVTCASEARGATSMS